MPTILKILQICPYDIGRHGGVQRHILDLSAALQRAGHAVGLIAPGAPSSPVAVENSLFAGARREVRMFGTAFEVGWIRGGEAGALERYLHDNAFDIAHFHTPWSPFLPYQVFRRVRGGATRCVATFHDTPAPGLGGGLRSVLYRGASRALSRHLDAAIAVSSAPAAYLRLAPACELYVMPACIDLAPLRAAGARRPAGRPPRRILFVGRLEPRKGADVLVAAFAQLAEALPDARLTICGEGAERAQLQARAQRLRVDGRISFLGAVGEREKQEQFARADLFCAPSPYGESFGLVLAEAMAAGLPVVAAANSGYRTVLTGAGAEGLVPPGDAAALAGKLAACLSDAGLRARLAAWGRAEAGRADVGERLPDFLRIYAGARSKREAPGK
jgi:phosphatidylinositol alpha-mannosyltransferase